MPDYQILALPRLTIFSDTHNSLHRRIFIEKTDILFFAGDFSLYNTEEEV